MSVEAEAWVVDLELADNSVQDLDFFTSMSEKARAARLRRPMDRQRFSRGRAALRQILARRTGIAPQHLDIIPDASGRPHLQGIDHLDFNCSRTGSFAVIALSQGCRLGIDIEQRRDDFPCRQMAHTFFSASENATLSRLPDECHTAGFFQAWVSKEACVKAWGMGLSLPLAAFDVEADPARRPALLEHRPGDAPLWLYPLTGPAHHVVALAADRPLRRIDVNHVSLSDLCRPVP
ncbi:MAG: 4'-phosphopantetheinyl transferase superfamily protein [Zavarzinia sp.]|nr:4'-phosphopantetheinyl transferase superfamily protein [Zavarzinia sp.]